MLFFKGKVKVLFHRGGYGRRSTHGATQRGQLSTS